MTWCVCTGKTLRLPSRMSILLTCNVPQVIYCPKEVQLICLSATVSNPEELAGWIAQVPSLVLSCPSKPVIFFWILRENLP